MRLPCKHLAPLASGIFLGCLLTAQTVRAQAEDSAVGQPEQAQEEQPAKKDAAKSKSKKKTATRRSRSGETSSLTQYTLGDMELPAEADLHLRIYNPANSVDYSGFVNYDSVNLGTANQMYPGDNAGLFLVSIFTHAAVVEAAKNSKKSALQEEADKVLLPYKDVIAGFTGAELATGGLSKIPGGGKHSLKIYQDGAAAEWILESKPQFQMTADQRVLLLRNIVVIHSNEEKPEVLYQNLLEIHADPCAQEKPESCWLDEAGAALKNRSAQLFADSISLALADLSKELLDATNPEKTFSYRLGAEKTFQRGRLAGGDCNRMVIRTLRNWLLSVPVAGKTGTEATGCIAPATVTPAQAQN